MESLPTKTPVSVLQELLARRCTVPKYELVQIEGMIHEPTFRYRVTVADLVGTTFQIIFKFQNKVCYSLIENYMTCLWHSHHNDCQV